MRISRALYISALIVVLAVSVYLFWVHKRAERQEERVSAEELRQLRVRVAEMASHWNAITNWQDGFKGRYPSPVYTAEVEKAILNERPILIFASVDDLKPTEGGYIAELSSPVTQLAVRIKYNFHCDSTIAQRLMAEKRGFWELFAVIAHIDHVEKRTRPISIGANDAKDSGEESYFLVQGDARDVISVGVHGLQLARAGEKD